MRNHYTTSMKTKSYIVIFFWLLIVGGAFGKNYSNETRAHNDLAFQTARAFFDQVVLSRAWNAGHGGVYVPVSENTQPNPYLNHIKERDVTTTSGLLLTKLNPAYMTRQVHAIGQKEYGIQGHITSLKPLRPENQPDAWEILALKKFQPKPEPEDEERDIASWFEAHKILYDFKLPDILK